LELRFLADLKLLILATKINGILFKKAEMTKDLRIYEEVFVNFFESEESILEILGSIGG
jgi:hypothetical protein